MMMHARSQARRGIDSVRQGRLVFDFFFFLCVLASRTVSELLRLLSGWIDLKYIWSFFLDTPDYPNNCIVYTTWKTLVEFPKSTVRRE